LRHVPIPREVALEAIDAVVAAGFHANCYVDDLLYVAEVTPEARAYADFQGLEIHAVGPLHEWLRDDPTKLVAVGDPKALDVLEDALKPRFAGTLFVSKSLPYFLEFAHPDVSKGSGLQFVADRLGFTPAETVACGDGENDRELLDWAGFRVAVANAHQEILARAKVELQRLEEELDAAEARRKELLDRIPNLPAEDTPDGFTEEDAVEIRRVGEPPSFDFPVKDHLELAQAFGWIDMERAAKASR